MSNPISVRRVRVETLDPAGEPTGEVSYGVVASTNEVTLFADTWETVAALNDAIEDAGSILAAVDPDGEIGAHVDHAVIGTDNYYGTDAWLDDETEPAAMTCRRCGCAVDPSLDDVARMLRIRGVATGDPGDPKAVSDEDPALCVDCEDE